MRRATLSAAFLCLSAACALLAACGGGGGGGGGTLGPSEPAAPVLDGLAALAPPEVRRAGRVEWLLEALDGPDQVDGLSAADFQLSEQGLVLAAAQVDRRLLPLAPAVRDSYVLAIDCSAATLADDPRRAALGDAALGAIAAILTRPQTELALARLGGQGAEPVGLAGGALWSRDPGALSEALAALLESASAGELLALELGRSEAEAFLLARLASPDDRLPPRRSRGSLVILAGAPEAGPSGPPPAPAPIRRLGLSLGSPELFDLSLCAGVADWTGALPSSERAQFEAYLERRLDGLYRLAYLTPARPADSPVTLAVEASGGGGSAQIEAQFSALGLSDGAGHLAAWPVPATAPGAAGESAHRALALDGSGRMWIASDLAPLGFVLTRRSATGELDPSFASGGRLELLPTPPASQWRALAIAPSPTGSGLRVLTQRSAPGPGGPTRIRGVLIEVDERGLVSERELPPAVALDRSDYPLAFETDSQGRLWIAGSADGSALLPLRRALWRLNGDLSIDASLGGDGVVTHQAAPGALLAETAVALALVEANGSTRAVLAGSAAALLPGPPSNEATLVAFAEDGSLWSGFGNGGLLQSRGGFHASALQARFTALRRGSDGLLWASGAIQAPWNPGTFLPALWRLSAAGEPDGTFGLGDDNLFAPGNPQSAVGVWAPAASLAEASTAPLAGNCNLSDLVLTPAGAAIALGWRSAAPTDLDALWMRWDQAGRLATEFNRVGFLIDDGALLPQGSELPARLARAQSGTLTSVGAVSANLAGLPGLWPALWIDTDPARAF
jgi:hypothetical protein